MDGNVWVTMVWYESLEKLDWYGDYLAPEKKHGDLEMREMSR